MEPSKPWTATVTLGQRIVKELGLDNSVDTLGRWMAHRVAELMQRAEQAEDEADRESVKQECSELILKIWERRSHLPYGRPLAEVAEFLKKFTTDPPPAYLNKTEPSERTWVGILPILEALQEREDRVCRDAALADIPKEELEKEREWFTEHPEDISSEEFQTIQWFWKQYERMSSDQYSLDKVKAPNFANLPAEERTRLIRETLALIEADRKALLMSIESLDQDGFCDDCEG